MSISVNIDQSLADMKAVAPLNKRLEPMGMTIRHNDAYGEWLVHADNLYAHGMGIALNQKLLNELLAMSDDELREYMRFWSDYVTAEPH